VDVNVPARLTRAETQARTRQKLLDSGARAFAKRGYAAASIEEIAASAGFTRGAFYANFSDKADLFLTILESQTETALTEVDDAVAAAPDDQKLGALLEWFDWLVVDRRLELAFGEFQAVASRDRKVRARLARRYGLILDLVTDMIESHCEGAGVTLPVPARTFATMVVSIVDGLTVARRLVPDDVPPDRLAETLDYLWAGLTVTAAPSHSA
jgi:AcrR family transcriptional regulator